jgi:hypothetical protein
MGALSAGDLVTPRWKQQYRALIVSHTKLACRLHRPNTERPLDLLYVAHVC